MAIYIPDSLVFDRVTGEIDVTKKKFYELLATGPSSVAWDSLDFTGSSLADLATRSASDLSSGTVPLARLAGITNSQIATLAAIAWTKISKVGGLVSDLASQGTTSATGNQDNVNFANVDSIVCNNGSLVTFRGFLAGASGQRLTLFPINAQVDLAHLNGGSSAANQIITATAGTVTVARFADLVYDGVTTRWRMGAYA